MGGYVTNQRKPMLKRKFTYGYQISRSGNPDPFVRADVQASVAYGLQDPDTVYSYRTNVDENTELRHMLSNEDFDPFRQHDTGHEFSSSKWFVKNNSIFGKQHLNVLDATTGVTCDYHGPVGLFRFAVNSNCPLRAAVLDWVNLPSEDLVPWGTKAIKAAAPTRSSASLAVALVELRDGLPKIPGMSLSKARNIREAVTNNGDEYLNIVFGWIPGINDIRQILTAMVNARKIINQYSSDTDKFIRRKMHFPDQVTQTLVKDTASAGNFRLFATPGSPIDSSSTTLGEITTDGHSGLRFSDRVGNVSIVTRTTKKTWFSGAFRYHLNDGEDIFSRIDHTGQVAARLLGARLDPASLWQAMPWSWLLDWFVDIGDIISNATAVSLDGQLLQYGYLMRTTTKELTITTDAPVDNVSAGGNTSRIGNLTSTYVFQRKERIRATPFGFGLNPNSFTAQQWAILGALGMTRAPKSLH